MEDYPSNSNAKKAAETAPVRKVEPVVAEGSVTRRKKPLGKKFKEIFFGGEDAKGVIGHVIGDVMIPAARDLVADAGQEAINRALYGEGGGGARRRSARSSRGGYESYSRYAAGPVSSSRREDPRDRIERGPRRPSRTPNNFDDFIIGSRVEADEVLRGLYDVLSQYGMVSVAELMDLLREPPLATDSKFGWVSLEGSRVVHTRGGYLLDLPRPEPLD